MGVSRKIMGIKFFIFKSYCELWDMDNDYLQMLVQIVLPTQILDYFIITGVDQTSTEIHISLDEKMYLELKDDVQIPRGSWELAAR